MVCATLLNFAHSIVEACVLSKNGLNKRLEGAIFVFCEVEVENGDAEISTGQLVA